MAGVGQTRPGLSIPSPSELAGGPFTPAVTPSSVALMTQALREGFLTADDIIARTGKQAQLKEKANVMALTEQMSPEAVQARQQSLRAGVAQSELGAAQATAALPLVQPTAALQQQQLEQQAAYQKYPAAKLFDQYAPVLGLEEPQTPDKQIDWSRKASIGVQIAEHLRLQNEAKEKLTNIKTEKSPDGSIIAAFTKQGLPVNSAEVQKLETQARSPFRAIAPGTAQTASVVTSAPQVVPLQSSPDVVSKWRAQLINEGIDTAAEMADTDVARIMESRRNTPVNVAAPTAAAKPVIEIPAAMGQAVGGGFSLGPPKATEKPALASEQQKTVAQQLFTVEQTKGLLDDLKELHKSADWLTGPVAGRVFDIFHPENWNKAVGNFERSKTSILANLAKGIYHETGVLSDKDIERYGKALPSKNDTAEVAFSKFTGAQKDIFISIITNVESLKASGKTLDPRLAAVETSARNQLQSLGGYSSQQSAATPQGNTFEIQGIGKVFRGADGKMYRQ